VSKEGRLEVFLYKSLVSRTLSMAQNLHPTLLLLEHTRQACLRRIRVTKWCPRFPFQAISIYPLIRHNSILLIREAAMYIYTVLWRQDISRQIHSPSPTNRISIHQYGWLCLLQFRNRFASWNPSRVLTAHIRCACLLTMGFAYSVSWRYMSTYSQISRILVR
jgi:hypothetical protein